LRQLALACARRWPVSDDKISFEYKLKRFLQGSLLSPEAAHVFWNGTFSDEERQSLYRFAAPEPWQDLLCRMAGGGLQRCLQFDQRYFLPDDILYKVDRISMAHSLEVRPPFLDDRIADFAASLPAHFKLDGSNSKRVLRDTMRGKLPHSVLSRPKMGFDIPVHDWLRGPLRSLLLDTLTQSAVEATGLFHWPAVERLIQDHLERRANFGYHLWGLITLFLWMRRWNVQLTCDETAVAGQVPLPVAEAGWLSLPLPLSLSRTSLARRT
jgi:asparagine synthase (glutamine-hydrolysing)